ncbi:MAG TPA: sulfatase-like hydrolase/transferase, partial [Abditibacteriaceae bacterium]
VLRGSGYGTYMSGKWHVTKFAGPNGPKENWPRQRGFDKFYGTITGAGSFFDPTTLCRDNTYITPQNDPEYKPQQFYYTDAIADNAIKFLEEHQKQKADAPFFLYVGFTTAHWPMHALPEDIAKYKGHYNAGYDAIRQARWKKQKELGVIDASWPLPPTVGDWQAMPHKAWDARNMEVYAAMIDRMDQGIGRILAQLKQQNQLHNTLIFYLHDNGGCAEGMGRDESKIPENIKPLGPNDLQPQIWPPMQTRDGRPVLSGPTVMAGGEDTYIGYGRDWANVSNTPFREYKHWVHEGGIATPLIVHWPQGVPTPKRGALVHNPGQLVDIMATCVDVSGAAYPQKLNGETIHALAGHSLKPSFANEAAPSYPLFWEHEGNRAIREGQWKLVAKNPDGAWELYNMSLDRAETRDLAAEQPERVQQMAAQWEKWAKANDVLPWIWKPQYGAKDKTGPQSFELKQGEVLEKFEAPQVGGAGFKITAEIIKRGEGVLVAHGGVAHGYSLFIRNDQLHFAVRAAGKLKIISTLLPPGDPLQIVASLSKNGEMAMQLSDDAPAVTGKAVTPLANTPADALSVGYDINDPVADYKTPFRFDGALGSVVISIE